MRRFACILVFACCAMSCLAQYTPKAEVFGGFSYLNYEAVSVNLPSGTVNETCSTVGTTTSCQSGPTPTVNFTPRIGLYGMNGSVTADLTPWFGFTTDVSGSYGNATDSITTTLTITSPSPCTLSCTTTETYQLTVSNPTIYTFLFGPQFTFRAGKAKIYGRFLVGGEHKSLTESQTDTANGSTILVSALATPLISGSYFAMAFGGGVDYPIRKKMSWRAGLDYFTSTGTAQNNLHVYTGPVWKFGK